MPVNKLSIQDFAAKIKAKYPDYKDINDTLLTQRIVEKYPEYKDMVNYQVPASQPPVEQPKVEYPEHEISHNSIHDIRHLNEMANQEIPETSPQFDPVSGSAGVPVDNTAAIADKKAYGDQYEKATKELGDRIGATPDKAKAVLQDFPDDVDEESIKRKSQLLSDNPESYSRLKSADENVKLLAKKGGVHVANEYNHLQGTQDDPIQDLNHLKRNIYEQQEMILSNLSGPERAKALANLERNRSSAFNAVNPEIVDEYNGNEEIKGQLNAMQYAGLKSLEAFDPQKAKLYSGLIYNVAKENESNLAVEQKIGLEKIRKELLDIGRKNTERYINESQYDLDKAYRNAQTDEEKNDISQQWLHNKALIESMNEDTQKDATRFPYMKDLEFERQAKELSGEADMGVLSYALNKFGRGIGKAGESVQIAMVNALGDDQDVADVNLGLLGQTEQEKNKFYLPEADKPEGSPMVYKFDKYLEDAAKAIKNNKSISEEDKKKALIQLVKAYPDQVHTITNTAKYGKSANLFSKATLYKNAGMIGDIASIAAQAAGSEGIGLPKLLSSTIPMYLNTQSDFYREALEQGKTNPMAYANTHAAIMMAAGIINPDLSIVKRALGGKTELGKALAGVSEDTWNGIVSKNKPIINKIKSSLGGVAQEAAKMGLTYGAGTSIASDLANKGFFNSNKSGEDILNDAVKATKNITTSSLALLGLHGISNFKTVSPEEKGRVWELGDNPRLANERIDDAVKSGEITTQIADQRKQIIKQISKLIDSVPTEDSKGKPLTDQQRSDYLYNLVIKNKIDGIKGDLPDAQKAKLEGIKLGIDIDNNAILDPKSEKENLMQRKRELTDELTPGEDGTSTLTPLEKKTRQEELDGINEKLDEINNPKPEKPRVTVSTPNIVNVKLKDNAIQEQSPGEMGVRESQAMGEGMGQGNAKPESTTGEGPQGEGKSKKVSNEELTGITHVETDKIAQQFGLDTYEKNPETVKEWDAEADRRLREDPQTIPKLIRKLENRIEPDKIDQRVMMRYMASLKAKIEKTPTNELLAEMKHAKELSDTIGGREVAKSLVARKGLVPVEDSLADYMVADMESLKVDELTKEQKASIKKEYDDIQAAKIELDKKIQEFEEQKSKAKAEKAFKAITTKGTKKAHADYVQERKDILAKAREALLKSAKGGDGLTASVPGLAQLAAIAPHVKKMVESLVSEGVDKLEDVVKAVHEQFKDIVEGLTEKNVHDIIAGEYNDKKATKSELRAKIRDLNTLARLQNRLEDLNNGIGPKNEKEKIERNKEIADIKKKIAEHPLSRLAKTKSVTERQIKEVEKQLETGDFSKPEKDPIELDKEAKGLKTKLNGLRQDREIRLLKQEYANRSKLQKVGDAVGNVLNVPRSLMSSLDFSAPLRQGIFGVTKQLFSRPGDLGKQFSQMFKVAFSQKKFDNWFMELKESPDYETMQKSGLPLSDPHDPKLSVKEEAFMSNLAEKIPLIGRFVKGSERAYVTFLNKMRVDLFRRAVDTFASEGKTFENSPELYKAYADYIGAATGRGRMPEILENSAPILNAAFFSPRLIASRLNLLTNWANPKFYTKIPKEIRVQYFKDMAKFIGLGVSILALAKAGGAEVEDDPHKSDFGKIKVGNTRWDIWGGFQQYITLASRLISGPAKTKTGKPVFGQTRWTILERFARGKLAPVPGSIVNLADQKDVLGKPVTPLGELKKNVMPLVINDIVEAAKDRGVAGALGVGIPSMFGVGVQTYDSNVSASGKKKTNSGEHPERNHK